MRNSLYSEPAQLWGVAGRRRDVLTTMDTERLEHAIALRDTGRVEEALKELAALTELTVDPEEKATLLLNETRCYRLLGRLGEAGERLSCARRIVPQTQALLYLHEEEAILHWHKRERDKALKILGRLCADYGQLLLTPEHHDLYARVQTSRGMLLTELTRYGEARPLLEECLSFDSPLIDKVGILYNLGLCSLKLGKSAEAKEGFQEVLRNGCQADYTAMAHFYLGTIYFAEVAYAMALIEFESCLACGEGGPPKQYLYKWLASTARTLGMREDAERYERLAKASG